MSLAPAVMPSFSARERRRSTVFLLTPNSFASSSIVPCPMRRRVIIKTAWARCSEGRSRGDFSRRTRPSSVELVFGKAAYLWPRLILVHHPAVPAGVAGPAPDGEGEPLTHRADLHRQLPSFSARRANGGHDTLPRSKRSPAARLHHMSGLLDTTGFLTSFRVQGTGRVQSTPGLQALSDAAGTIAYNPWCVKALRTQGPSEGGASRQLIYISHSPAIIYFLPGDNPRKCPSCPSVGARGSSCHIVS